MVKIIIVTGIVLINVLTAYNEHMQCDKEANIHHYLLQYMILICDIVIDP